MTVAEIITRACEEAEKFDEACRIANTQSELTAWIEEWKAYKETGLTPEEIHKLISIDRWNDAVEKEWLKYLQMEKEGRLVILPCKVTDTVYITEAVFENEKQRKKNKPSGERVVSAQIDHVTIGGTTGEPVFDLCTETGNWYYSMEPEQFYLTREAAEAALKEQEG